MSIIPVLLCGGKGKRLWPASTDECPKPFLSLSHPHLSLFQQTLNRFNTDEFSAPWCVGNQAYKGRMQTQAAALGIEFEGMLLEAKGRNTAPAAAFAALAIARHKSGDALMLLAPTDHAIQDEALLVQRIQETAQKLESGQIGLFGVPIERADTGCGYIETRGGHTLSPVGGFVEKPSAELAEILVSTGRYRCNSGLFLVHARTLLDAFETYAPALLEAARRVFLQAQLEDGALHLPEGPMQALPSVSLDVAIMQKAASHLRMSHLDCGWSDLGHWESLWHWQQQISERADGFAEGAGMWVGEHELRPWGRFSPIRRNAAYCIKRLEIAPGAKLSLQWHRHRDEYWEVMQGFARVTCGDTLRQLCPGESCFVPRGTVHRIENQTDKPLIIIEIQTGSYLGEDDIVRLEDVYGRVEQEAMA